MHTRRGPNDDHNDGLSLFEDHEGSVHTQCGPNDDHDGDGYLSLWAR